MATDEQLQFLPDMIQRPHSVSRNQALGVLVGSPCFVLDPSLAVALGADAVASDAAQALGLSELLLESRSGRLVEAAPWGRVDMTSPAVGAVPARQSFINAVQS